MDHDELDDALEALRHALDAVDRPVATSPEVADLLDVSRPTATSRLNALVARGDIRTDKVGRTRIWWLSPAKTPTQTPAETSAQTLTSAKTPADRSPDRPDPDRDAIDDDRDRLDRDELRQRVADLDLPGSGSQLERREETVVAIVDHVLEHGPTPIADLKQHVDADEVEYSDEASAWSNLIRSQRVFHRLDAVEPPGQGGKEVRPAPDR